MTAYFESVFVFPSHLRKFTFIERYKKGKRREEEAEG
jgi:hypothetical protein